MNTSAKKVIQDEIDEIQDKMNILQEMWDKDEIFWHQFVVVKDYGIEINILKRMLEKL